MNYKIITIIVLSICILNAYASTCNFDFSIPGVGNDCEMKGGLPQTLIDKYSQVFGGVEGLKLIVDDKKGLRKFADDQMSKLQREQQIYSQNINQITQDIQNVKHMLGIFPISGDLTGGTKAQKRALDPLQTLKDALKIAEMKLANMTRNMEEDARRRSITFSSLEQVILQQDQRLTTTLQKIADLEKKAKQLPGVAQTSNGGLSSLSLKAAMDIATISSKIQATSTIIQARVQDLNERLLEMDKPIQQRNSSYQMLDNNLIRLQSGVSTISNDAANLEQSFQKTKNDFSKSLKSVESDIKQREQSYQLLLSSLNGNKTKVDQFANQIKQEKQTLQNATATIAQLNSELPQIKSDFKVNITDEVALVKKDPYFHLAQVVSTLSRTTTNFVKDAAKDLRYLAQIRIMIRRLNSTVTTIQAG